MSKTPSFSQLTSKPQSKDFPVVAIGASAGGLEALQGILKHLSPTTGLAYVYIQHLSDTHSSSLKEILARSTSMEVIEATEKLKIEADKLYIIPPAKEMTMVDGVLLLNPRTRTNGIYLPIDQFFVSLSETRKQGAIGVVLSGAAHDGAIGLKAIKKAGGITIAQNETAEFQSMPKAAIAEGVVDMVLSPQEIAKELERLGRQADFMKAAMQDGTEVFIEDNDENLLQIIQLLKKTIGVDFTHYKMNTIKRRIVRRMLIHKLSTLHEYFAYLKEETNEPSLLYQDLLINVTAFFRDEDTLEYAKKTIIPQIIKSKKPNEPIRIWVPACSTGEEAYSLAMICMEVLGAKAATTPIQIFATDLSELMISKARMGIYSKVDLTPVSSRRMNMFFTKIDGSYRIVKSIRDICVFAPHNIFKDPPFSRIDLVSCCNLMIYLNNVLQKKILSTFHYALNPSGFLILGKSESVGNATQFFSPLEKNFRVFAKKNETATRSFFEPARHHGDRDELQKNSNDKKRVKNFNPALDLERTVDEVLLNKYVPPSVVVNQDLEILQFRGSTGFFLEPLPGRASLNLLKMAKPGLGFELRNTVHKAQKAGEPVKKTGIEILINDVPHHISIEASPLKSDGNEQLFLLVFEKMAVPDITELKSNFAKDKMVKRLEADLQTAQEDMRSIIEEQQATNEELQSANEEIVSSNEELQSINEELETSKEELESSNEELMTINTELQIRNEQLSESYDYAEAVFGTIREAILVLDKDLMIKTANKAFYKTFHLSEEQTEGLFIYEVANRSWDIPAIRHMLTVSLLKQIAVNDLKIRSSFPGAGPKILLINACKVQQRIHQQQIILLAIEDITDLKEKLVLEDR